MYIVSSTCQIENLANIYRDVFGYPSNGVFVEVGAHDGELASNTSCLADHGWSGLCIEPIKEYADACIERHKNNKVVVQQCAIGMEEKIVDIYFGGPITTTDFDQVRRYITMDWARNVLKEFVKNPYFSIRSTNQFRLDTALTNNRIPYQFDLLVVDVEGTEDKVLNSFDLSLWSPKMLIIELEDGHPSFQKFKDHVNRHQEVRTKVVSVGYKEIYRDIINTIFVRE